MASGRKMLERSEVLTLHHLVFWALLHLGRVACLCGIPDRFSAIPTWPRKHSSYPLRGTTLFILAQRQTEMLNDT